VRQRSRQREFLCSPDGESVWTVVVVLVTTVALALSALHEPPYTEPYVRWCGRTAEGDSASYPINCAGDRWFTLRFNHRLFSGSPVGCPFSCRSAILTLKRTIDKRFQMARLRHHFRSRTSFVRQQKSLLYPRLNSSHCQSALASLSS
jgi:hypothetical protein